MVLYYHLKKKFEGRKDVHGHLIENPTFKDKIYGIILTGIYSVLVVLFNIIYKEVAFILSEL